MRHDEKDVFRICDNIGETCNSKFQLILNEDRPDRKSYRFYGLGGAVDITKEELVYDEGRLPYQPKWEYSFYCWPEGDGFVELTEDDVFNALFGTLKYIRVTE